MFDACENCLKDLADCETIWAFEGSLYCSRQCGIDALSELYGKKAEQIFDERAEELLPEDAGII